MSDHNTAGEHARETERKRIARDLHDDLGSHLTAIKMALAQLIAQLPAAKNKPGLHEQARYADNLVDGAIDAMHDIIDDLHPAVLDLGLYASLAWLAKIFARQTGVPHRLTGADELPALDAFQTVSLYRIVREALHNSARHASARHMSINAQYVDDTLRLEVVDDGVGVPIDADLDADASGIRGMQQRAAAVGAQLTLTPAPGGGTRLHVALSVPPRANLIE